ncbi:MAG: DUF6781 family protein [Isosphaeraceae bacterium]
MSETPENPTPTPGDVQSHAEAIVSEGREVRANIAKLVGDTAAAFQKSGEGLIALTRAVMAGAGDALEKGTASLPAEGPLRQVIDGLGDGLSNVALSARMAIDEARSKNQQFAAADLTQIRKDLGDLTTLYINTVSDALSRIGQQARTEVTDLADHAEKVKERVTPNVQSAIDAAVHDPVGLGKESLQAGLAVTREATGSLFSVIGKFLQETGEKLSNPPGGTPRG